MKYENLWELWEPVFTEARPLPASDPSRNKRQAGLISEYFGAVEIVALESFDIGDSDNPLHCVNYTIHSVFIVTKSNFLKIDVGAGVFDQSTA